MKIRCGDSMGIDLDKVVTWKKQLLIGSREDTLVLFFAGADDSLYLSQDNIGCQAFERLHKLLLDRFAIDLAADNDIPISEDATSLTDELLDLPF